MDIQNISHTQENKIEIDRGIIECDILICVLTEKYYDSKWCMYEFKFALENEKQIFPIFLDHPPSLCKLPLKQIAGEHFKLFENYEVFINRLNKSLIKTSSTFYLKILQSLQEINFKTPDGKNNISISFKESDIKIINKGDDHLIESTLKDFIMIISGVTSDNIESKVPLDAKSKVELNKILHPANRIIYKSFKNFFYHMSQNSIRMRSFISRFCKIMLTDTSFDRIDEYLITLILLLPLSYLAYHDKIMDLKLDSVESGAKISTEKQTKLEDIQQPSIIYKSKQMIFDFD